MASWSETLPPGPTEPPAVQTARWLLRPIAFLESCRRRYGDAFSVTFTGFQSPLVLISDPEAIRALYTDRTHGLPAGRTVALEPILGSRPRARPGAAPRPPARPAPRAARRTGADPRLALGAAARGRRAPRAAQGDAAAVPRRADAGVRGDGRRGGGRRRRALAGRRAVRAA